MAEEKARDAVMDLIIKIRGKDPNVRAAARDNAGKVGAPAVIPLSSVMTEENFEVAREAERALWKIVRYAGRPKADEERNAVVKWLVTLLGDDSEPVRVKREAMWMLSEIAGDEAVPRVAAQLSDKELREDARMVLERLPGEESLAALQTALRTVPDEFKINVAESLRARGVTVPGLPSQKLVPTRKTDVKPTE